MATEIDFSAFNPRDYCGWLPPEKRTDEEQALHEGLIASWDAFRVFGAKNTVDRLVFWDAEKLLTGNFLPHTAQEIGDCVSWGLKNVIDRLSIFEIIRLNDNEIFKPSFAPYFYGISRVQIGRGRINGDGSMGSWAAEGAKKYGVLASDESGVPPYSGDVARKWGRTGPPAQFIELGKKHLVKTVGRVSSADQLRDAICNGYPCTIASTRGFNMRLQDKDGKSWYVGRANWPHQMSILGYDSKPVPSFFRMNQWGCYDDRTDVLTENGWVRFSQLKEGVKLATLNQENHELEYQMPTEYHEYDYDGFLTSFKSRDIDLLVTGNHRMYSVSRYCSDVSNPANWIISEADDCQSRIRLKKDAKWIGVEQECYNVGGYEIPMDDWLEFLGYYVSEGNCCKLRKRLVKRKRSAELVDCKNGKSFKVNKESWIAERVNYNVRISQKKPAGIEKIQECLSRLPFKFIKIKNGWTCSSKALWFELQKCGTYASNKKLPNYFRNLSTQHLRILYKALMLGDGHEGLTTAYYTSSHVLADQFQELLLKAGLVGDVSSTDRVGRTITRIKNGKTYTHTHRSIEFKIGIKIRKMRHVTGPMCGFTKLQIPYKGKVYCSTVPNGLLYVRRNGRACWCGNSNAHGPQLDGPGGGGWQTAEDLDRELRNGDTECYSFSQFDGFPGQQLNWSAF